MQVDTFGRGGKKDSKRGDPGAGEVERRGNFRKFMLKFLRAGQHPAIKAATILKKAINARIMETIT